MKNDGNCAGFEIINPSECSTWHENMISWKIAYLGSSSEDLYLLNIANGWVIRNAERNNRSKIALDNFWGVFHKQYPSSAKMHAFLHILTQSKNMHWKRSMPRFSKSCSKLAFFDINVGSNPPKHWAAKWLNLTRHDWLGKCLSTRECDWLLCRSDFSSKHLIDSWCNISKSVNCVFKCLSGFPMCTLYIEVNWLVKMCCEVPLRFWVRIFWNPSEN